MKRFLHEWVLHNLGLKLLALAMSFLLWTTYTSAPVAEVSYLVPIEFNNLPKDLEISGDVLAQARVRVRGRAALLRRLSPSDLGLSVDMGGARPGDNSIPLTPDQVAAPYGATVVRVTPAQVRVPLAPRRPAPE